MPLAVPADRERETEQNGAAIAETAKPNVEGRQHEGTLVQLWVSRSSRWRAAGTTGETLG